MFFDDIIEKFNLRFDSLEKTLTVLTAKVDKIEKSLGDPKTTVAVHEKTFEMFKACAKGFRQVRDACHSLREDLSEAKGTIVDATWGDHSNR